MEFRSGRRHFIVTFLTLALLLIPCHIQAADLFDHKIQQVNVNKPNVTVYYRDSTDDKVKAYLDGEELKYVSDSILSEQGVGIDYYLLVDISGSISDFDSIKEAIAEFRKLLRENDRMILVTFGDDVNVVLNGSEKQKKAGKTIRSLEAHDHTTVLAEAVRTVADMMDAADDTDNQIKTLTIISDGKPDTDQKTSISNAEKTLVSKGIQTYTIAVANNEGDSQAEIDKYRSQFNDIAGSTGGLPYTIDTNDTESVLNALQDEQNDLMNSNVASFKSSSNKTSFKTEEFILQFLSSGSTDKRDVLVNKHQADNTLPEVVSVEKDGDKSIVVVYSEPVNGADVSANYDIKADGAVVPVLQIISDDPEYRIVLGEKLRNADYRINISGVTDLSQEENGLETEVSLTVNDVHPEIVSIRPNDEENGFLIEFSETVNGADQPENYKILLGDDEQVIREVKTDPDHKNAEVILKRHLKNDTYVISFDGIVDAGTGNNTLLEQKKDVTLNGITEPGLIGTTVDVAKRWWPVVLTVLVLLILLFIFLFMRKLKKKKLTVIAGEIVKSDNVDSKFHVGMESGPAGIPITMWISNGHDEPKEVKRILNGSMCVGRSPKECDVFCDDRTMSKQHFMLSMEKDGNMYITDLESTNGTSVNGVRIRTKWKLMPGDEVFAGNLKFHFDW